MEEIKLEMDSKGYGHFFIVDRDEKIAEMEVSILENSLTVYHTEILPKGEGKGLARKLLAGMVDYSRKNSLRIIPFCPYVHAQFKRHPEKYADVWDQPANRTS